MYPNDYQRLISEFVSGCCLRHHALYALIIITGDLLHFVSCVLLQSKPRHLAADALCASPIIAIAQQKIFSKSCSQRWLGPLASRIYSLAWHAHIFFLNLRCAFRTPSTPTAFGNDRLWQS